VLISRPSVNTPEDFAELARFIREADPRVHPVVLDDREHKVRRQLLRMRRTMLFSPAEVKHFRLRRGVAWVGNPMSKSEEMERLVAAGISIPPYELLTEDQQTKDLSHLGDYVVTKPDRGGRGANVLLLRASKVKWAPQETRIAGKSRILVAQKFIWTGPFATSYRVTSLFGECLWSEKVQAGPDRAPQVDNGKGVSGTIVSSSKGSVYTLNYDEEIIQFGLSAHRAFPKIPLLGVDVIRDARTGELFVTEVNASGYVWHFTSPKGLQTQAQFGYRLESQFDGRRKAAGILARKAMELAK
jgi:glutathione synthase/RimK-type ligase-like ATP-grasp enzyme